MASSKAAYLQKYLSGGKKTKKKAKKKVTSKGAVKLIDEDDDWRTYAPSGQSNIDYVTAERGENAPVVVVQDDPPKAAKPVVRAQSGNWASDSDSDTRKRRRRHDSDSDDASPPRRARHDSDSDDASPPRRARHDSDSDDASPPRRARHDSDSDASPPRRARHDSDSDAAPPRRARHDSDSDASPPRRARHDSDSDASPPRRARHDSDSDASPPRRKRARSSSSDVSVPRKAKRGRSSSSDVSVPRRGKPREKMASGASAGLQHAGEFKHEQERLRRKNEAMFAKANAEMQGAGAKTVYRDKHGRKVDKEAEVAKQLAIAKGLDAKKQAESYMWNTGVAQKRLAIAQAEHLAKEAAKPLARYADDADRDALLKSRVRADDPMAAMLSGGGGGAGAGAKPRNPIRQRARMCPNRFKIPAGYRWDGEDRGNGFEKRLLLQRSSSVANAEAKYKWSVADM